MVHWCWRWTASSESWLHRRTSSWWRGASVSSVVVVLSILQVDDFTVRHRCVNLTGWSNFACLPCEESPHFGNKAAGLTCAAALWKLPQKPHPWTPWQPAAALLIQSSLQMGMWRFPTVCGRELISPSVLSVRRSNIPLKSTLNIDVLVETTMWSRSFPRNTARKVLPRCGSSFAELAERFTLWQAGRSGLCCSEPEELTDLTWPELLNVRHHVWTGHLIWTGHLVWTGTLPEITAQTSFTLGWLRVLLWSHFNIWPI